MLGTSGGYTDKPGWLRQRGEAYGFPWMTKLMKRKVTAVYTVHYTISIDFVWSIVLEQAISDQVIWEEHAHVIDPSIDYTGLVHTGKL